MLRAPDHQVALCILGRDRAALELDDAVIVEVLHGGCGASINGPTKVSKSNGSGVSRSVFSSYCGSLVGWLGTHKH
jgi:hypothetical protein